VAATLVPDDPDLLAGNPKRRQKESIVKTVFAGAATTSLVISILIVGSLLYKAQSFVGDLLSPPADALAETRDGMISLSNLWADQWAPRFMQFDIKTLLVASLIVTVVAMAVAGPIGLGAAVYLSEYANPRVRRILKPILEVLAGIPSVVLGFFALRWIGPNVVLSMLSTPARRAVASDSSRCRTLPTTPDRATRPTP